MGNKIPWAITLGQKTLGPYYKYIVKSSPKTVTPTFFPHSLVVTLCHFSLKHTTYFPAIIPLATPFPTVYIDITLYPLCIHSLFNNYPWWQLENQPMELQN